MGVSKLHTYSPYIHLSLQTINQELVFANSLQVCQTKLLT